MPLGTIDVNRTSAPPRLQFPEDLGSDYYGHFMTFSIFTSDNQNVSVHTGSVPGIVNPVIDLANRGVNVINDTADLLRLNYSIDPIQNLSQNGTYNTLNGQIALFIPGGTGSTGMIYDNDHEYADIRLTNLMGTMLGGSAGGLAATAGGLVGRTVNPGVEVLYRTTKLRTFMFTYLMAPASQAESYALKEIIRTFRAYAAPEPTMNNMVYKAPAEFEIKFFNKNAENDSIPKIGRCVLEKITVDYAPQGEWSTFRNGYPVAAMLSLVFQEMEIMTKPRIEEGY